MKIEDIEGGEYLLSNKEVSIDYTNSSIGGPSNLTGRVESVQGGVLRLVDQSFTIKLETIVLVTLAITSSRKSKPSTKKRMTKTRSRTVKLTTPVIHFKDKPTPITHSRSITEEEVTQAICAGTIKNIWYMNPNNQPQAITARIDSINNDTIRVWYVDEYINIPKAKITNITTPNRARIPEGMKMLKD